MNKKIATLFVLSALMSTPAFSSTISGTVKYDGEAPKFKEIKMDADPVCLSHYTEAVMPQTLVLGDGNTMGNVFVYIKSGITKKDFPPATGEVVVDQKGCMYEPHVVGVRAGQTVKILNPDGTLHNVHAMSKANGEFNLAMPKFRTEVTKVFDKPEFMFALKCDVHPWMGAWMTVMSHPYFATTKADGKFSIADLPAGTYELEAWHEKLGPQVQTITVADGVDQEINFSFSKPAAK